MASLGNKDTERLEVVRYPSPETSAQRQLMNQTIDDLETRTSDLEQVCRVARTYRVRQEIPASATVEVEAGTRIGIDGATVDEDAADTVGPVTAAAAGKIRVDLVWYNLATGALVRTAGTEVAVGGGFITAPRPSIPANDGAVPLAYLYVDETPTSFEGLIAPNTAGAIEDVRPLAGFTNVFEASASNLKKDGTAAVGTLSSLVRSDHRHPTNSTTTVPAVAPDSALAPGVSLVYARRDHQHFAAMEEAASGIKADAAGGALGTANLLAYSDHAHPLSVSAAAPAKPVASGGAAPGTSSQYARADHVHELPTVSPWAIDDAYLIAFGGNVGTVATDYWLIAHSPGGNAVQTASTEGMTTAPVPVSGTITRVSWSYFDVTANQKFRLWVNGSIKHSWTSGAQEDVITGLSIVVSAGQNVEISAYDIAGDSSAFTVMFVYVEPS
jgi:hypothetical protein